MTAKLLIPILHFSEKIPDGMIWAMHQSVTLMQINASDLGPLTAHIPRDLYDLTDRDTGCFYITLPSDWESSSDSMRQIKVNRWATLIRFALHRFMGAGSGPLQLTYSVELQNEKFARFYSLTTVDSSFSPVAKQFLLPPEDKRATINTYFSALLDASVHFNTLIAYERYNSSLFRSSLEDKLIDCTISAESLIGATTELSYKFSLFLSFVAGQDATLRTHAFSLLRSMYDARSKLVHGDPKSSEKLRSVTNDWPEIQKIILGCLDYYTLHHTQPNIPKGDWINHLNALVIGTAARTAEVCKDLTVATTTATAVKANEAGQLKVAEIEVSAKRTRDTLAIAGPAAPLENLVAETQEVNRKNHE
jgi:hypothetical protein